MMKTKHEKLRLTLSSRILDGEYAPGQKIPTEAELMREFSLSRNTVRQALNDLEKKHLLIRQPGRGTFVSRESTRISNKVALFLYNTADLRNSVTTEMASSFCTVLETHGYIVDILLSPRTNENDDLMLLAQKYAAFGIGTSHLDQETIHSLRKLPIPYLFIKNYLPARDDIAIRVDFFKAGFLAAEHLYQCGCKTLALVHPGKALPIAAEFYDGVSSAVMEYGLYLKQEHIFETVEYDSALAICAAEKIISMKRRPEGIIACTDETAHKLMEKLTEHGIRVPEEMMIIGCNDTSDLPYLTTPPLTNIALPMKECGAMAAETLLDMIRGLSVKSRILSPALIKRKSTILK